MNFLFHLQLHNNSHFRIIEYLGWFVAAFALGWVVFSLFCCEGSYINPTITAKIFCFTHALTLLSAISWLSICFKKNTSSINDYRPTIYLRVCIFHSPLLYRSYSRYWKTLHDPTTSHFIYRSSRPPLFLQRTIWSPDRTSALYGYTWSRSGHSTNTRILRFATRSVRHNQIDVQSRTLWRLYCCHVRSILRSDYHHFQPLVAPLEAMDKQPAIPTYSAYFIHGCLADSFIDLFNHSGQHESIGVDRSLWSSFMGRNCPIWIKMAAPNEHLDSRCDNSDRLPMGDICSKKRLGRWTTADLENRNQGNFS